MDRLIRRTRIEYCLQGVDICNLAILEDKARRCVHPSVRAHYEPGRCQPTNPDGKRAEPVRKRRESVPTIQVQAEEDRFQEERKSSISCFTWHTVSTFKWLCYVYFSASIVPHVNG